MQRINTVDPCCRYPKSTVGTTYYEPSRNFKNWVTTNGSRTLCLLHCPFKLLLLSDLVWEEWLAELQYCSHGEGQGQQVDVPVGAQHHQGVIKIRGKISLYSKNLKCNTFYLTFSWLKAFSQFSRLCGNCLRTFRNNFYRILHIRIIIKRKI